MFKNVSAIALSFGLVATGCENQTQNPYARKVLWLEPSSEPVKPSELKAEYLDANKVNWSQELRVYVGNDCDLNVMESKDARAYPNTKSTGVFEGCTDFELSPKFSTWAMVCDGAVFALYDSAVAGKQAYVFKVMHSKNPMYPKGYAYTLWKSAEACTLNP